MFWAAMQESCIRIQFSVASFPAVAGIPAILSINTHISGSIKDTYMVSKSVKSVNFEQFDLWPLATLNHVRSCNVLPLDNMNK